jgi:hypothetical protein
MRIALPGSEMLVFSAARAAVLALGGGGMGQRLPVVGAHTVKNQKRLFILRRTVYK